MSKSKKPNLRSSRKAKDSTEDITASRTDSTTSQASWTTAPTQPPDGTDFVTDQTILFSVRRKLAQALALRSRLNDGLSTRDLNKLLNIVGRDEDTERSARLELVGIEKGMWRRESLRLVSEAAGMWELVDGERAEEVRELLGRMWDGDEERELVRKGGDGMAIR